MPSLNVICEWLGLSVPPRVPKTPAEKLLISIRATAKCKFNSSLRLKRNSKFSFFTTTILSLGLILIPLLQNSSVKLHLTAQVLNMMQIFLAVSVLVYSIVMAKAGLDVRAEQLNECGDRLKDLARKLDREIAHNGQNIAQVLENYNERYSDITTDTEGHSRLDYLFAKLDMPNDYPIRGLRWIWFHLLTYLGILVELLLPAAMIGLEILFISDMLGISQLLPASFHAINC
ncbi:MAG: hypothetical protein H6R18_1244 [Proteobacteria bacterium]|nr:hypothetical protein [Pseudomonadota bacterium]